MKYLLACRGQRLLGLPELVLLLMMASQKVVNSGFEYPIVFQNLVVLLLNRTMLVHIQEAV